MGGALLAFFRVFSFSIEVMADVCGEGFLGRGYV